MSRATTKLDRATRKRLVERLSQDAAQLAVHFGLRFREIEAERAGVKARSGACFEDGTIKIRLVHAMTGRPLQYSSLVDTLCHELAHLKYWHHGPRFQAYYKRILAHARREGIYQPRPRAPRRARPIRPTGSTSSTTACAAAPPSDPSGPPGPPVPPFSRRGPEQLSLFRVAR